MGSEATGPNGLDVRPRKPMSLKLHNHMWSLLTKIGFKGWDQKLAAWRLGQAVKKKKKKSLLLALTQKGRDEVEARRGEAVICSPLLTHQLEKNMFKGKKNLTSIYGHGSCQTKWL